MSERMRKLRLNSTSALLYQGLLVISGLILPRCFLSFYGSEVNGLISSITQFLTFINICDMGISAVITSALYKPLAERDHEGISRVFVYSKKFFRGISYLLIAYIVVLLFVYPGLVEDRFSGGYTILLIICMSISNFSQYFLGISYQLLLIADQRSYVQIVINGVTLLANVIISVVIMVLGGGIHTVKLVASLIYILRPVFMALYVKRNYQIDEKIKPDANAVPQKRNGIIQHISYIICENTDVAVLTAFATLSDVSVYSVYYLALNSIRTIIGAATTGVQATFGNMIAREETRKLQSTYGFFEWLMHGVIALLFVIAGRLLIPFVLLYTKNINDANYNVPLFAVLITIAYAIYTLRNVVYVMIRAAGHYKQTQVASLVEAILNLGISVIMVSRFGLVGVAIGTLTAEVFFSVYLTDYLSKNIVYQKKRIVLKQVFLDIVAIAVMLLSVCWIDVSSQNFMEWIGKAVLITVICGIDFLAIQCLFARENVKKVLQLVFHKKENEEETNTESAQKAILSLIQSSIEGTKAVIPDEVDWEEVVSLSCKAKIEPLVFEAIRKNHCALPEEGQQKLRAEVLKRVLMDQHQEVQIQKLKKVFLENKIDFAFLKGASVKGMYPSGFFRAMGDIDILIKTEQYDAIKELMQSMGYTERRETDHELIWTKLPYVCVELHKKIVPSSNKDFFAYYGTGWDKLQQMEGSQFSMSPEDEFIYLLTHFSKHYRDGGIGVRHMIDLWLFRENHKYMDEAYLFGELEKLQLKQFYVNIIETMEGWFRGGKETVAAKVITNTVFQSGSFGNREKSDYAYALKMVEGHANPVVVRILNFWNLVFMPLPKMKIKYPVLEKKPYLMPAFWVVRWWSAAFFKRENVRVQAKRLKRINKKDIKKYQKELNAVGLDYFGAEE